MVPLAPKETCPQLRQFIPRGVRRISRGLQIVSLASAESTREVSLLPEVLGSPSLESRAMWRASERRMGSCFFVTSHSVFRLPCLRMCVLCPCRRLPTTRKRYQLVGKDEHGRGSRRRSEVPSICGSHLPPGDVLLRSDSGECLTSTHTLYQLLF